VNIRIHSITIGGVKYYYVPADIIYVQVATNYINVHLDERLEPLTLRMSLTEFMADNIVSRFLVQVHGSYAVNIHKVAEYTAKSGELKLTDGTVIYITESYLADYHKAIHSIDH